MKKKLRGILFALFLVAAWQVAAMIIDADYILPSPVHIIQKIWIYRVEIFTEHLPATMYVVLVGSAISIVLGVFLAIIMDISKIIERALYPILTISQTIPTMCIAPILVVIFGYVPVSRIIVVVLMTFFSITVDVFDGLRSVNREMTELVKTYGATKAQIFFKLKIPAVMPSFFSALKISLPWAVVGAAIAEWLGAPAGLGCFSYQLMMKFDGAGLFAPIVVVAAVSLLITQIIKFIQRRVCSWSTEI